jgi:hypothetical protein
MRLYIIALLGVYIYSTVVFFVRKWISESNVALKVKLEIRDAMKNPSVEY